MIQAIKDLANSFVPSGKLIELVDRDLMRASFYHAVLSPAREFLFSQTRSCAFVSIDYSCNLHITGKSTHYNANMNTSIS
uniref:Uncharacterized protein n=1 Tax=Anguilla anguilla TaxID=7936 RepID=A0A0E9UAM1_ANGAN